MQIVFRFSVAVLALLMSSHSLAAPDRVLEDRVWALLSIPGDPGAGGTVQQLFGDDLAGLSDNAWAIFGPIYTDGQGLTGYQQLQSADLLEAGMAYWMIQASGQPLTLDVPDNLPQPESMQMRGCASINGCMSISLLADSVQPVQWNMLGYPVDRSIPFAETRVATAQGSACDPACTLDEAEAAQVLNNAMWRYPQGGGAYDRVVAGDTLNPWDGYWAPVLANARNVSPMWLLPETIPDRSGGSIGVPNLSDYAQVFEENFDGTALDPAVWNTGLLWGPYVVINNEEQVYIDQLGMHSEADYEPFVFTGEGTMKIVASSVDEVGAPPPIPQPNDPVWSQYLEYRPPNVANGEPPYVQDDVNYLSGIMTTYESFKFTHGYVEARAKVPTGRGLWPAFWLLPTHYVEDVPEIDVMESLGQFPYTSYHTYHYFIPSENWRLVSTPSFETIGPDFSQEFHTYGMAWEPGQIIWYVDGVETRRIDDADWEIANQAMYLIANLAVGGNWPGSPDANTVFPAEYELDYIRVYKKNLSIPVNLSEYVIVFEDNFGGTQLDATKWNSSFLWGPWLTINDEEQYYVDALGYDSNSGYSPFDVSGGFLTIIGAEANTPGLSNVPTPQPPENAAFWQPRSNNRPPLADPWTYQADYTTRGYTSGILTSYNSFKFVNGYAEVRARVPEGDGLWPAFWLLNGYYVGRSPEIDIMEFLGEDPTTVIHAYHRNNALGVVESVSSTTSAPSGENFTDDFHTYGVQWTRGRIDWYVDGQLTYTVQEEDVPYQVMYVILNLAVGGSFNSVPVDTSQLPAEYVIDYVRVYQAADSQ